MFGNSHTRAEGGVEGVYNFFHITLFIAIAMLVSLGLYLFTVIAEEDIASMQTAPGNDTVASLRLSVDSPVYATGDEVLATVLLTTNRRTLGVDVVIQFDPDYLELVQGTGTTLDLVKNNAPAAAYFAQVKPPIYDNFPYAKLERRGEMMTFSFSAITKPLETFKGSGAVATLRFQALKPGVTAITIISDERKPQDSNVAFEGRDILTG